MPLRFSFLTMQTPREAKISDHDPIIFDEYLVWNVMMQGSYNESKRRYNNGLILSKESQKQYQQRLTHIVKTIAEACHLNPNIHIIALEEAPIKQEDIQVFIEEFKKHEVLSKFFSVITPSKFGSFGVATFINTQKYAFKSVSNLDKPYSTLLLENRTQEFILMNKHTKERHYMTNVHLPFDLAKGEKRMQLLGWISMVLSSQTVKDRSVTFLGDFNFNPILLFQACKFLSGHIPKNNNTLVNIREDKIESVFDTVDAVASTRDIKYSPPRDASNFSLFSIFTLFKQLPKQLAKKDQEKDQMNMPLVLSGSFG